MVFLYNLVLSYFPTGRFLPVKDEHSNVLNFFKVIPLLVCYQRAKVRRKTGIIGSYLCDLLQASRKLFLIAIRYEKSTIRILKRREI